MSIRKTSIAGVAIAALLLLTACTADASEPEGSSRPPLEPFMDQNLEFGECDPAAAGPEVETFAAPQWESAECAMLTVPLDYDEPDGASIELAVLRVPATGDDRIGSVVVNPGGPGVPATSFAPILAAVWTESPVVEQFDIVGFDPRGVGESRPAIDCYSDEQRDDDATLSPLGGWTEEMTLDVVEQCAKGSGGEEVLEHIGTRDSARDMDVLREALGDDKLSFIGVSYGTRLGAVYGEMFPQNIRALVLDAAVDPSKGTGERQVQIATGLQLSFERVASFCADLGNCPLGDDPAQATAAAQELLRPLLDQPIITADGREVSFTIASEGIVAGLYSEAQWPRIVAGLAELRDGRADELLALRDEYHGRAESGEYPDTFEATFAINCMDEERLDAEQTAAVLDQYFAAAPFIDPGVPSEPRNGCEAWPGEPTLGFPYATDVDRLPQTLVISVTGDPVTPHEGGINLAAALGARLLTVDGAQHGATISRNPCIDGIVAAYFIDLELPDEDGQCSL